MRDGEKEGRGMITNKVKVSDFVDKTQYICTCTCTYTCKLVTPSKINNIDSCRCIRACIHVHVRSVSLMPLPQSILSFVW